MLWGKEKAIEKSESRKLRKADNELAAAHFSWEGRLASGAGAAEDERPKMKGVCSGWFWCLTGLK